MAETIPFPTASQSVNPAAIQIPVDQLYSAIEASEKNRDMYQDQWEAARQRERQAQEDITTAKVHANSYEGERRAYANMLAGYGLPPTRTEFLQMIIPSVVDAQTAPLAQEGNSGEQ